MASFIHRLALVAFVSVGFAQDSKKTKDAPSKDASKSAVELPDYPVFKEAGAMITPVTPLVKPQENGRNLWLDTNPRGRRVIIRGEIVQQKAVLEEFLCLKHTKEHESIVAADIHAQTLHAMLVVTGAEPGKPAQFSPKFEPASGAELEITIEWKAGKEFERVRAQELIRDAKTGKAIEHKFVFAGSGIVDNPITKEPYYMANDGDIISVANFISSMIDIAVQSTANNDELVFDTLSVRIPPIGTEVFVVVKPVPKPPSRPRPVGPGRTESSTDKSKLPKDK